MDDAAVGRSRSRAVSPARYLQLAPRRRFAVRDRAHGRARPADRLRARLRVLAGLPGRRFLPRRGEHSTIEFGNRVVALAPILLSLAAWIAAPRTPGLPRARRIAAESSGDDRAGAARLAHDQARPASAHRGVAFPACSPRARGCGRARRGGLGQRAGRVVSPTPPWCGDGARARRRRAILVVSGTWRRQPDHTRRQRQDRRLWNLHDVVWSTPGRRRVRHLVSPPPRVGRRERRRAPGSSSHGCPCPPPRADGRRRDPVPDSSSLVARARSRRGREGRVGRDRGARRQLLGRGPIGASWLLPDLAARGRRLRVNRPTKTFPMASEERGSRATSTDEARRRGLPGVERRRAGRDARRRLLARIWDAQRFA